MLKFYCLFYLKPDIYLAKYLRDFLIMTKFYFKNKCCKHVQFKYQY